MVRAILQQVVHHPTVYTPDMAMQQAAMFMLRGAMEELGERPFCRTLECEKQDEEEAKKQNRGRRRS